MAKKPKRAAESAGPVKVKHENPFKHFAEEVESHLIEGAELATSTTSAETNVLAAAIGAIEGPPGEPKPKAGKRGKARPKAR